MPNSLPNIHAYSTKQLVDELLKRKGVEQLTVAPHTEFRIDIDENWDGDKEYFTIQSGSARILIITD